MPEPRTRWTVEERQLLGRLIDEGLTSREAAKRLPGRTFSACIGRAAAEGWHFGQKRKSTELAEPRERRSAKGSCMRVWVYFDQQEKIRNYMREQNLTESGAMRELISFGLLSLEIDE